MSLTTNSHSETDHLFEKREIFVSSMLFNTSKNSVQQNEQLWFSIHNSNLTVRSSNQQQFTEIILNSDALKWIFQINNKNIKCLLNAISAQCFNSKEKQKFSKSEHYESKSKKKYCEWTWVIIKYLNAKTHVYLTKKDKIHFAIIWIKDTLKTAWELWKVNVNLKIFTWLNLKRFLLDQLKDFKNQDVNAALCFKNLKQSDN